MQRMRCKCSSHHLPVKIKLPTALERIDVVVDLNLCLLVDNADVCWIPILTVRSAAVERCMVNTPLVQHVELDNCRLALH